MRRLILAWLVFFVVDSCVKRNKGDDASSKTKTTQFAGVYEFGDDVEKGPVGTAIIYSETDSTILFYLDLCRGAPSYNLGELYGRVSIDEGKGIFDVKMEYHDKPCTLIFEFKNDSLIIDDISEPWSCGFAGGVAANGGYKKQNNLQPEYFEGWDGKPVYFSTVSPEKYNEEELYLRK
jgi:hypothetical protein